MDEKEKRTQEALGLEKLFIVNAYVKVPVYVTFPIIVKEFTEEGMENLIHNLTDEQKKNLIHQVCKAITEEDRYADLEYLQDLGDAAVNDVDTMSKSSIHNLDPKALTVSWDIKKEHTTIEAAKTFLQEKQCVDTKHIIIIE